jgi:hypothetical protein
VKHMSNCWKALIDSMPIVTDWLAWKPRNGRDIRVGLDLLIGSHYYYKLSESLVSTLHSKGIFNLYQVASLDTGFAHGFNWKTIELLDLIREQNLEWENYVRELKHSRIVLSDVRDKIVWSWDNKEGKVSTKQAYEVIVLEKMDVGLEEWMIYIWNLLGHLVD